MIRFCSSPIETSIWGKQSGTGAYHGKHSFYAFTQQALHQTK